MRPRECHAMPSQKGRHLETIAIAEAALGSITAHAGAADPRSYELWYKFAAGDSGLLNAAVNSRLDRNGTLSARDIEEIYSTHISSTDTPAKVDKLGARVADEIAQVVAMIEAAEGSASHYSANLTDVSQRLGTINDREGVRAIVESLVLATKEMEANNLRLQEQLQALWEEVGQLRKDVAAIRTESLTDALTALGNRKFFNTALEKSVAECHADNAPMSLLLADVDHFKNINDTFGHVVGDRVLRFVASTLKQSVKGQDIVARFGGEEFAVILPRTPLRAAVEVADQLRLAVMKAELIRRSTGEKQSRVTISIGVASLHHRTTPQALLEAADVCLYAAKRSGRNCVIGEKDERLFTAIT
jgi:diguanylate cyclase